MSAVTPTNATVSASGIVTFEYDGVLRAQPGSEIAAAVLTGQITETQIADNAISTPKLQAGSVITAKLAAAAVTAGTIAAEAIETGKLKAGAVTAGKIAVSELSAISANIGTVTAGVIQGPTIRTGTTGARVQLTSNGLQAFNAGGEEVLSFSTATGSLFVKGEIKAGSTVPATTITGTLTNAQIAEIAAAKITGTITETQIGNEVISTAKLQAASVSTAKLAAAAVTAEKIAVAELSAITANLGTVTAGSITGVKITGAEIFIPEHEGVTTYPEESKYRLSWIDAEGKPHSSLWSGFNAANTVLQVVANRTNNRTQGIAEVMALGSSVNNTAQIKLASSGTTTSKITIAANTLSGGSVEKTLLTQAGASHFLQVRTAAKRVVASGAVNAAGTILNGSGFTVSHPSTGNYTIKLTEALSSAGSLFVEVNGAFTQIHKASGPSTSEWSITINGFSGIGGGSVTLVATDEPFSFFVIQH